MSYNTLEFRLFSTDILTLYNQYFSVSPKGIGILEPPRTDIYLNCRNTQNGIKIRDGGLEVKILLGSKSFTKGLFCQNWVKWRYHSKEPKEDKVSPISLEAGWLSVAKNRKMKSYFHAYENLHYGEKERVPDNGVNIDFTEVQIPDFGIHVGTLGIEVFSSIGIHEKIMKKAIELIGREHLIKNSRYEILSYPEFIYRYCIPFQNEPGEIKS